MLTYEDMTGYFLKAADSLALTTHPEYWLNSRTLEREFTCTCHTGNCEEAEHRSSCSVSFTWGSLDTALSIEGPAGVCDFFHEADQDCPHLHTSAIPPLVLDLSYTLALNGTSISEATLLSLTQMLKLRASEHSRRTIETRPGVSMVLHENRLQPDMLTLQQRVELPIWHPEGMRGLHDDPHTSSLRRRTQREHHFLDDEEEGGEIIADNPRAEEWLPQVMVEVCQDILHVLEALDATLLYDVPDNSQS
ncbi:hypothetical protein EPA93_26700 [Ktedonosporobacter rubrisoli]|uniref:Uncharacterized protein n=1 Tax=Ktedonosporobacter rubrisoli TaxID=2509675 RepID=A0A4P6JVI7_KTERU|nr:hypothetical protein [Ktedonosporobacter rubrisoli]QBD79383.1 hypothetical protein EPA93_26700 [Ktedonosporobacter rubrisoli]